MGKYPAEVVTAPVTMLPTIKDHLRVLNMLRLCKNRFFLPFCGLYRAFAILKGNEK